MSVVFVCEFSGLGADWAGESFVCDKAATDGMIVMVLKLLYTEILGERYLMRTATVTKMLNQELR